MSRKLPRVEVKPVVGDFDLVSIDDLLLEDSVSISKTVAPGGVVERSQAVEEAGCETTEAAIAQRSVVFLSNDVFDAESKISETG